MKSARPLMVLLCFGAILSATPIHIGELAYVEAVGTTGTGLGAVFTLMTTRDQGCVGWNGTSDVTGSGCASGWFNGVGPGTSNIGPHTQTRPLSDFQGSHGIGSFGIVFNPSTLGSNSSISLDQLILVLFDEDGNDVFRAVLNEPFAVADGGQGAGVSGFKFNVVNWTPGAEALFENPDYRVGIAVEISGGAQNGAREAFFMVATPEPQTYAMLGAGLIALAFYRRKSRRS